LAAAEAAVLLDSIPDEPTLRADDTGCDDVPLEETEHPDGLGAGEACRVKPFGIDAGARSLSGNCAASAVAGASDVAVQVLGVSRGTPP
jgi:hypothetical protein